MMPTTSAEQRVAQPGFSSAEQAYFPLNFVREHMYAPPIETKLLNGANSFNPGEPSLDGISALLKAKEIVDRRTH